MTSNTPWPPPQPSQLPPPPEASAPTGVPPVFPPPSPSAQQWPSPAFAPEPPTPRSPGRALALTSSIVAGVLVVGLILTKFLQFVFIDSIGNIDDNGLVEALGVVAFASIVLILIAIVAGHIAFALSKGGSRSTRLLAELGFSIGYVMLLLYILRLLATVANMQGAAPSDHFTVSGEFFWWG